MIGFYFIDYDYIKYLKKYDRQVPSIDYTSYDKFFCGIVLKINGFNYYAPISHDTHKQRTNIVIKNKNRLLSSIKFCFMIPTPDDMLQKIDFKIIGETDKKYADLLKMEHDFCLKNEQQIHKKAKSVYRIGCNKNHVLNYTCCDFKLLEQKCKEYNNMID